MAVAGRKTGFARGDSRNCPEISRAGVGMRAAQSVAGGKEVGVGPRGRHGNAETRNGLTREKKATFEECRSARLAFPRAGEVGGVRGAR